MQLNTRTFDALKSRQRAERDAWASNFGTRIHRAISWVGRAEAEHDDPAASFLFLWIAFNAAYGGERSAMSERDAFETFFRRLERLDRDGRLYSIVWTAFPGAIRLFLDNRYVFRPFWDHIHNNEPDTNWEARFEASRRHFHAAVQRQDTVTILSMLFDRLYVLRNQVMHGGATWNSRVNTDQLREGSDIMTRFVPVMIDLMMDDPDADWGTTMYPVIDD